MFDLQVSSSPAHWIALAPTMILGSAESNAMKQNLTVTSAIQLAASAMVMATISH